MSLIQKKEINHTPDYASAATDDEEETGYPCWVQDSDGNWYYRLSEGVNAYGWQAITNSDGKKGGTTLMRRAEPW